MVPSNDVGLLDRALHGPPRKGEIRDSELPVRSDAVYRQIALAAVSHASTTTSTEVTDNVMHPHAG